MSTGFRQQCIETLNNTIHAPCNIHAILSRLCLRYGTNIAGAGSGMELACTSLPYCMAQELHMRPTV
jgi:hypothetical protein